MSKRNLLVPIAIASSLVGCAVAGLLLWLAGREMTATMISLAEEEGSDPHPYPPCSWVWGDMASAHRVRAWWSTWSCVDCGSLVQLPDLDSQLGCNQQDDNQQGA